MTKYQHKAFSHRYLTRLEKITRAVCTDFETELIEFNGETTTCTCW